VSAKQDSSLLASAETELSVSDSSGSTLSGVSLDSSPSLLGASELEQQNRNHAFKYYSRLRKLEHHLLGNISEPMSLCQAAALVSMHPVSLSSFFSKKVGKCFSDWQNEQRVTVAAMLIRQSNISLVRVALETGFLSQRTFQRKFKKHTGVTPALYRQKNSITK